MNHAKTTRGVPLELSEEEEVKAANVREEAPMIIPVALKYLSNGVRGRFWRSLVVHGSMVIDCFPLFPARGSSNDKKSMLKE